jgi:hypothetical protein
MHFVGLETGMYSRRGRFSRLRLIRELSQPCIFEGRYEDEDARKSEEDGIQGVSIGIKGVRNALCWA